ARRPVAVDALGEHDWTVARERQRERGVVGVAEQPVLQRRSIRDEDDRARAQLLLDDHGTIARDDEGPASRLDPRTLTRRAYRAGVRDRHRSRRRRRIGPPARRRDDDVSQPPARISAHNRSPAGLDEAPERAAVVSRERRSGIEDDERRAWIEQGRVEWIP